MPGPEVHSFSLATASGTTTNPVLPGKPVTIMVRYISPANIAPTLSEVDIDGIPYTMSPVKGTSYATGVTYAYMIKTLGVGNHFYRFRFDDSSDGSDLAIYEGEHSPSITPVLLTQSSVSPMSGTSTTVFTFQTTYADQANQAPTEANLYVDSIAYPMTYMSGSYTTGALFQVSMTLPTGNHTFAFVFADSVSSWSDPKGTLTYAGPSVGANAGAVKPGTMITQDPHDDPPSPGPDTPLGSNSDG